MYVELKNINKTYGDFQASNNVSVGEKKGTLTALLGPSGSGKTTLLRMIAGLEQPDSGEILIDGQRVNDIPASKRGIGFVFQNYALFRYKTVYDNIAFGLKVQKWGKNQIKKRVMELIDLIGLQGLEKRYPSQLSGGQRQRVAFARALAANPHVLLLDEPFAAIDAKVRKELRSWLKEMIEQLGITSIFVTHDQDEAIEVADEIIITNQGQVEQKGDPYTVYQNPETSFVANFFGEPTKVPGYANIFNTFEQIPGADYAIVRPEFVQVTRLAELQKYEASESNGIVEKVNFRGNNLELSIRVGDETKITARRSLNEERIQEGEEVNVFLHRLFVAKGKEIVLLQNRAKIPDSLVI